MTKKISSKPFSGEFLSEFVLTRDLLPFSDKEIVELNKELLEYEQLFMSPDIEKYLISKNELLASFAISKAEESSLTLKEAQGVYGLVLHNHNYDFIGRKITAKQKLTKKDYEKLEFFNIVKTFRALNQKLFELNKLTPKFIKNLHLQLTAGLDIFHNYLSDFTLYKAGKWRDNNDIRVGSYIPPSYKKIEAGVKELVNWLKHNSTITDIAVFHTALYALHPFNNGNKRVCRILEHILLKSWGINSKNLYSTSYYYHKQKDRYYKYLFYSLERKNLNHFTSFVLEAIVLSIISALKTSLEVKRSEFLEKASRETKIKSILKPLIKRHQLQFKTLFKFSKRRIARQTFVSYLQKAVENKVVNRHQIGRAVYYQLDLSAPEDEIIKRWLNFARERLSYIPHDIILA